jgi:hypothetical protein
MSDYHKVTNDDSPVIARLSVNCFLKTHMELVELMVLYMNCVRMFSLTYLVQISS